MKQVKNVLTLCYNKQLFISSIGMCVGQLPYILISTHPIRYYYFLGLVTSLLNHLLNEDDYLKIHFRILDRSVMVLGAGINFYLIKEIQDLHILVIAIFCYFFSKVVKLKIFHIFAHVGATVLHQNILTSYQTLTC